MDRPLNGHCKFFKFNINSKTNSQLKLIIFNLRLKKHESEDLFGIQLAGSYSDTFTKACQLISENCQVDFVDVNCGCPIDLVFNKGAGSALA